MTELLQIAFESGAGISLLVLFAATIAAHGFLLLNDGVYWDGWAIEVWQRARAWKSMHRFFSEVGMPNLFHQHKLISFFPARKFLYNLIGFVALYVSAACVLVIGVRFCHLSWFNALCISLLMVSYPGQQMAVERAISMQYLMPVAVFCLAALVGLYSDELGGILFCVSRVTALALFFFSFVMNSLLTFFFGFVVLAVWIGTDLTLAGIGTYLFRHLDYVLLPFAFWFAKEALTPRHGVYANYNRTDLRRLTPRAFCRLLQTGVAGVFAQAAEFVLRRPLGWALLVCGEIVLWRLVGHGWARNADISKATCVGVAGFGLALLFLAALPYMLVGQPFGLRGWETKNNVLLALPVSLVLFGFLRLILPPALFLPVLGAVILLSVAYLNYIYLCWVATWAKNRSFLHNLARIPEAGACSVLKVTDQHPIRSAFDFFPEHDYHPEHRDAYLTFMFESLWGSFKTFGIYEPQPTRRVYSPDEVRQRMRETTHDYQFEQVDPAGRQGRLLIREGRACPGELRVAFGYLWRRLFRKVELEGFLQGLTDVHFTPAESYAQGAEPSVASRPGPDVPALTRLQIMIGGALRRACLGNAVLRGLAVCVVNRKWLGRWLQEGSDVLTAVYDFRFLPYALGDILTWNVQTCIRALQAGKNRLDICLVADRSEPANRYQPLIDSNNYLQHLIEMLPLFYVNPMLENLHVLSGKTSYGVHCLGHDLFRHSKGLNLDWFLDLRAVELGKELVGSHSAIKEFHAAQGYVPRLQVPQPFRDRARAMLSAHCPNSSYFVCIHLRQRFRDKTVLPTSGVQQLDRDAKTGDWVVFLDEVEELYPEVMFVLVGRPDEWAPELLDRKNIFVPKRVGCGLTDELAMIQECDLFMGSNSGPAVLAMFSTKPYFVFETCEGNFELESKTRCVPIGAERLPFALERQKIKWGPAPSGVLMACFEEVFKAAVHEPAKTP